MSPREFVSHSPGFGALGPTDQVRAFAWYLHCHRNSDRFSVGDIVKCFDDGDVHRPQNVSQLVNQIVGKDFIRDSRGLRVSANLRSKLDTQFGHREETAAVDKLLSGLPARLSDVAQQDYLREALVCFRHKAFRASIIMTWNVVYDHLVTVVSARHLPAFNAQMSGMFGGKKKSISSRDDFQNLKESEVLEVCRAAALVSKEIYKVLDDKLGKRNSAAHPSGSTVDKLQAEAYISDIIHNAMLKIT